MAGMHELSRAFPTNFLPKPSWIFKNSSISIEEQRQAHSQTFCSSFHCICIRNSPTLSLLSCWNVRPADDLSALIQTLRDDERLRQSDSPAEAAVLRPDMHLYSGQMSTSCRLYEYPPPPLSKKKVALPLASTEKGRRCLRSRGASIWL